MGCGRAHTWPVGSRPAGKSPFGVMDMVGNIREWTQDCYSSKAYARCGTRCKDPVFPCTPNLRNRTLRGASWVSHQAHSDPRWRRGGSQGIWSSSIGFRCAKSGH
jgi:formylglycine-generating enzyme required for sulfatase activity